MLAVTIALLSIIAIAITVGIFVVPVVDWVPIALGVVCLLGIAGCVFMMRHKRAQKVQLLDQDTGYAGEYASLHHDKGADAPASVSTAGTA